jgi:hypothetical protein
MEGYMTDQEQAKWLKQIEFVHDLAKHITTVAAAILAFSAVFIKEPDHLGISSFAPWLSGLLLVNAVFVGILVGIKIAQKLRTFALDSIADNRLLRLLYLQMGLVVFGFLLLLPAGWW